MKKLQFWIPYKVEKGDTLASIAKQFAYENAGPIIAYNADRLPDAIRNRGRQPGQPRRTGLDEDKPLYSDQIDECALKLNNILCRGGGLYNIVHGYPIWDQLNPKEIPVLEIPWHPIAINDYISRLKEHRTDIVGSTWKLVDDLDEAQKDLASQLFALDLLAAIATAGASLTASSAKGMKAVSSAGSGAQLAKAEKEALEAAIKNIKNRFKGHAETGAIQVLKWLLNSGQSARRTHLPSSRRLQMGFTFWVDNTIGLISPSKVASLYAAFVEKDAAIFFWGDEAINTDSVNKIISHARSRVKDLDFAITLANKAKDYPWYEHRVQAHSVLH